MYTLMPGMIRYKASVIAVELCQLCSKRWQFIILHNDTISAESKATYDGSCDVS